MSKNKSMRYQAICMLKPMLRLAESRQKAKNENRENGKGVNITEGIFSISTYKNYLAVATQFGKWAKAEYGEKKLANCRPYVEDYLKVRMGKVSPYTVAKDASALAKLYKCSSADFGVELPERHRADITKSREDVKEFNYEKHKDILDFIHGTGLRKSELLRLTAGQFYKTNGQLWVYTKGKGGKVRHARILPNYQELVEAKISTLRDDEKVFKKGDIIGRTPCHHYRAQYAKDYYNMIARPIDTLSYEEKYF